jgi:transcription elongation factor SPT5
MTLALSVYLWANVPNGQLAVHYTGNMRDAPQQLLIPPTVYTIQAFGKSGYRYMLTFSALIFFLIPRSKTGCECDIVFSLMHMALAVEYSANPLQIVSAFQYDSLPGTIYVEAHTSMVADGQKHKKSAQVLQ